MIACRILWVGFFLLSLWGGASAFAQSISISDISIAEGQSGTTTATFQVRLSQPSLFPISVDYATANGTATAGTDYTATSGTLNFLIGNTNQTISVIIAGDTAVEPDETFFVNLTNPFGATIQDNQGVGTITNDDVAPSLSINDVVILEGNSGTSQALFTVMLQGAPSQEVTVEFSTANGTATAGSDYTATNGVLTFPPGTSQRTISVPVAGDTEDEGTESFSVNLSNAVNATVTDSQGTATILSEDGPMISIQDATVTEGHTGTSNAVFTLTLSGPSTFPISVDFATTNGTAMAGTDYTSTAGTVTFPAGTTVQSIDVPIIGDRVDETDETFSVILSNAQNAQIADGNGLGTITDDDSTPSLSISDSGVLEGDTGSTNAVFNVLLSTASGDTVTVEYATMTGTAGSGSDFTPVSGVLTFAPGTTNQSINVPVLGDSVDESDETFFVTLANATGAGLGDAAGEGVITDNDTSTIRISDVSVTEGNSGSVNAGFTVSLSGPSAQTVTVDYATANGTATSGSDYQATNGVVTFAPGQTSQNVSVNVIGDTADESNETLLVDLSNASGAAIADNQGIGTILDDDGAASLSINDVTVTEGNSGTSTATFTVTLLPQSLLPVTVDYATSNGSAVAGSDYAAVGGTLTFIPGATAQIISVPIIGDTVDELDENFFVNLSNPVNATITDGQGVGTIIDNDGSPSLSVNDVSVVEGNAGTTNAVFSVSLNSVSAQIVTVNYATRDGSAVAGADYAATSGTLTFAPGTTNQTISVSVIGDTLPEINEIFLVILTNAVNASIADGEGTGTITNDDEGSVVVVNDVAVQENDAGTNLVFTVSLTSPSTNSVSVDYVTAEGSATDPEDYLGASGTLVFAPGETNQTVSIGIVGDEVPEFDENFFLRLSNATNAFIGDAEGVGTIANDDAGVAISINDVTVTEGDGDVTYAVFNVRLSSASSGTVSVEYRTENGSAIAGPDYESETGVLTFTPGATNHTIAVAVNGDAQTETAENFFVILHNAVNGTISDGTGEATILDEDPAVDLVLSGFDSPDPVLVGCDLTYFLSVTNVGATTAHDVVLINPIPAGALFMSATSSVGTCTFTNGLVVCELGTLPTGANATVSIVVVPTLDNVGVMTSEATVSPGEDELTLENNRLQFETAIENQIASFSATDVVLNGQTGLFEQIVTVTNSSCSVINAMRIIVTSLNGDVVVWNATGTNQANQPYLQHNYAVESGAVVEFRVEYYSRTRTQPVPTLEVEIQDRVQTEEPDGESVLLTNVRPLDDGSILVEFDSRPGRLYVIRYSEDLLTWKTAQPAIRATSNKTQWIDAGPPKTDRHPREIAVRFYEVFRR